MAGSPSLKNSNYIGHVLPEFFTTDTNTEQNIENKDAVMTAEQELDKKGRLSLQEWIRQKGEFFGRYQTGYAGKRYGELTADERLELAKFHQLSAQRHQEQAETYRCYAYGDPEEPAKIGL